MPTIRIIDNTKQYHSLLGDFPGITRLTAMTLKNKMEAHHFIETEGQSIHCRTRPIPLHRYEKVRKEFQNMMEQGLCRPSKNPTSSPLHVVPKRTTVAYQ
ncbi:Retrovirus-related Pol polyprotein from transposon opus [Eumeta japonica]|uniref:Retrovirus-related Pol polyprotein from transposon opus n=1 Tax=Eumeta variegata TaxID=151549 RepID=A0A4C1WFB8_EUMVA|nr:Retrovirus-related Pol polyprotein from transposon opus [Eumeta japonica]